MMLLAAALVAAGLPPSAAAAGPASGTTPGEYRADVANAVARRILDARAAYELWNAAGQANVSHDGVTTLESLYHASLALASEDDHTGAMSQLVHFWGRDAFLRATRDMAENGTARNDAFTRIGDAAETDGVRRLAAFYRAADDALARDPTVRSVEWVIEATTYAIAGTKQLDLAQSFRSLVAKPGGPNANLTAMNYLSNALALSTLLPYATDLLAIGEERGPGAPAVDAGDLQRLARLINTTIVPDLPEKDHPEARLFHELLLLFDSFEGIGNDTRFLTAYVGLYQQSTYLQGTRQGAPGFRSHADWHRAAVVLLDEANATAVELRDRGYDGVTHANIVREARRHLADENDRAEVLRAWSGAATAQELADVLFALAPAADESEGVVLGDWARWGGGVLALSVAAVAIAFFLRRTTSGG